MPLPGCDVIASIKHGSRYSVFSSYCKNPLLAGKTLLLQTVCIPQLALSPSWGSHSCPAVLLGKEVAGGKSLGNDWFARGIVPGVEELLLTPFKCQHWCILTRFLCFDNLLLKLRAFPNDQDYVHTVREMHSWYLNVLGFLAVPIVHHSVLSLIPWWLLLNTQFSCKYSEIGNCRKFYILTLHSQTFLYQMAPEGYSPSSTRVCACPVQLLLCSCSTPAVHRSTSPLCRNKPASSNYLS